MITADSKGLSERKVVVWILRALSYFVYFYLIVVEIILFIGFFLLLFGANPSAGFTEWAYRNLDRVMAPFRGIFSPIELGTTTADVPAVFETSVLFAMIIYGIVALLLSALIGWLSDRLWQLRSAEEQAKADAEYQQQLAAAQAAGHAPGQPATSAQPTMTPQAGAPTPPPPPAR